MKNASASAPPTLSAGLRRFLYFTAALTGAAILVVEILGAKMLSPYVGSSHFVWTAQIAVTLVALAFGYYFGGWLVDRSADLKRLYNCIGLAALYLAVTVLVCEKVAYAVLGFKSLAAGALLTSLFLFLIPLTLLAATGPFLIRVLARSVDSIGGQVGRLSAISTFGSVFGTILIGYLLVPYLANSTTMYLTAGTLVALTLFYYAIWARKKKSVLATGVTAAIFLATCVSLQARFTSHPKSMQELFHGNSNFGEIQVIDDPRNSRRFYLNDFLLQNTYDPAQKASLSLFTYMLHELSWAYADPFKNALCIGMGIGIVPGALAREGIQVDVVEINPAIVPVAKKYFDFDEAAVSLTIGDGRFLINKSQKHYDAILLDAFLGESSPSHLMTREAFSEMARLLGTNGVLVINSFGDFRPDRDFFITSLDKTLRAVFKDVRIHTSGGGNIFFAASQRKVTLKPRQNVKFANSRLESEYSQALSEAPSPDPAKGILLTDDFNPVDFYDAPNRERHRRAMALQIREL